MANQPLKVIHISNATSWRGGEQQIAYMVEELAKLGVEQMMVVAQNSSMHQFCRQRGINHLTVKKRLPFDPVIARKISKVEREFSAHLLHAHDAHAHTSCLLARILYGSGTPLVLHRRVDFPVGVSFLSRYKYNHPQVKKIICVSEAILQVIQPVIKDANKLTVVHSAIDPKRFTKKPQDRLKTEFGIPPDVKLIGNIAALTGHKDYYTFLRTAKLIVEHNPKTCFMIMGGGELYNKLVTYRDQLGLTDRVIFTGFRDDINEVLPELDVLLFTSEMEGLGTTVLDAFAAGVPVVATRAGGIPEMAVDKESALLADSKDAETLAYHVQRVLQEPVLQRHLIDNAFQRLEHFTKDQMANRILAVYKDVVWRDGS